MVTQDQVTQAVDGLFLAIAALIIGGFIGWLRYTMPPLICGARFGATAMKCELTPFHNSSHRHGRTWWHDPPQPRGCTLVRPCVLGHQHPDAASRDECETRARQMCHRLRIPPELALPEPRRHP